MRPRVTGIVRMSKLLALLACLPLAVAAAHHAATASGQAQVAAATECGWLCDQVAGASQLAASPPQSDAAQLAVLARRALQHDPLDGPAVRVLAQAAAANDPARGETLLLLSERVTRRDATTQLLLADAAIRTRDAAGLLRHVDRLLAVTPDLSAQVLPMLTAGLAVPEILSALPAFAGRPWFAPLLSEAASKGGNLQTVQVLTANAARHLPTKEADALVARILRELMARQAHDEASALIAALPAARAQGIAQFGLSDAATDPSYAPLTWSLRNDDRVEASTDGAGRVEVRVAPSRRALALDRTTLLAHGHYDFTYQFEPAEGAPRAAMEWKVHCVGGALLWNSTQASGAQSASITVPPGCRAQKWELWASAEDSQYPSLAAISGVALKPAAR